MPVSIPEIGAGYPVQCGEVSVFPLYYHQVVSRVDYLLAQDAIAAGLVRVRELPVGTTVPYILASNDGDVPVLFVEGEELRGARQNRVVNTTLMVGGGDYSIIPVTCTEWGRWRSDSERFVAGAFCPPTLRYLLKESRRTPLIRQPGHSPSQLGMWTEIRRRHRILGVNSHSENLTDALEMHREKVDDLRRRMPSIEDAAGVAVCVNEKIVCIDVFDKPATLARLWDRMVEGIAIDAMDTHCPRPQASILKVMIQACEMTELQWHRAESFGLGEEHITNDRNGALATAMVVDGVVLHASIAAPSGEGDAGK